ncbi:hypothetical protein M1146_03570 [Patescibacteria group bacterium]|nr:hypothetical protein [Patescibacteria group bacterium]
MRNYNRLFTDSKSITSSNILGKNFSARQFTKLQRPIRFFSRNITQLREFQIIRSFFEGKDLGDFVFFAEGTNQNCDENPFSCLLDRSVLSLIQFLTCKGYVSLVSMLITHHQFLPVIGSDQSYLLALSATQLRNIPRGDVRIEAKEGQGDERGRTRERKLSKEGQSHKQQKSQVTQTSNRWNLFQLLLLQPQVNLTEFVVKCVINSPATRKQKFEILKFLFEEQDRKISAEQTQQSSEGFTKLNSQRLCYEAAKLGYLPILELFMESHSIMDISISPEDGMSHHYAASLSIQLTPF